MRSGAQGQKMHFGGFLLDDRNGGYSHSAQSGENGSVGATNAGQLVIVKIARAGSRLAGKTKWFMHFTSALGKNDPFALG